jgi:hypothetical protein
VTGEKRRGFDLLVPACPDSTEPRSLRVGVRVNEVRLDFRRGRRAKGETFDVSDPEFEREVPSSSAGSEWDCYFSTYRVSL